MPPFLSTRPAKATVIRWGAWLVGLAIVVVLVHRVGAETVLATVWQVGPRVLWMVAAYSASLVVMALPLRWLLAPPMRPSLLATIGGRFAASGLNAILPLLNAGEPSRLLWLPRAHWAEGAAALIADRLVFAGASFMWIAIGATATLQLPGFPRVLTWEVMAGALLLFALIAAFGAWWRPTRALALAARLALRIWRRLQRQSSAPIDHAHTERLGSHLEHLLRQPGKLALVLVVHLCARGLAATEIYLALWALGAAPTPAVALALSAVPVALAFVGAIVPGQVGVQEGGVAAVAAALGLGAGVGLAVVLLQRVRQILFLPVTALLLASRSHGPPSSSDARSMPKMQPRGSTGNAAATTPPGGVVETKGGYLLGREDPP